MSKEDFVKAFITRQEKKKLREFAQKPIKEITNKPQVNRICCIEGCTGRVVAKDMCQKHYKRIERTGSPTLHKEFKTCSVEWCFTKVYAKGMCQKHYRQLNKSKEG